MVLCAFCIRNFRQQCQRCRYLLFPCSWWYKQSFLRLLWLLALCSILVFTKGNEFIECHICKGLIQVTQIRKLNPGNFFIVHRIKHTTVLKIYIHLNTMLAVTRCAVRQRHCGQVAEIRFLLKALQRVQVDHAYAFVQQIFSVSLCVVHDCKALWRCSKVCQEILWNGSAVLVTIQGNGKRCTCIYVFFDLLDKLDFVIIFHLLSDMSIRVQIVQSTNSQRFYICCLFATAFFRLVIQRIFCNAPIKVTAAQFFVEQRVLRIIQPNHMIVDCKNFIFFNAQINLIAK